MPTKSGSFDLTEAQRKRFREFLTNKLKETPCPFCGVDLWQPMNSAAMLPALDAHDEPSLRNFFPVVGVACSNCGYVALFHAIKVLTDG